MKKQAFITLCLLALISSGCQQQEVQSETTTTNTTKTSSTQENIVSQEASITLNGNTIETNNTTVDIQGSTVNIQQSGTYSFTGNLDNGHIVVNAPEMDIELIFDGVTITNTSGPAVHVVEAKDVTITLAKNSTNSVSDGTNYTNNDEGEDDPQATIFSMSDLKIKGEENATLTVNGKYNDGIVSKDDLDIKNATITVTSVDDGIRGKDSIEIKNSTVTIDAKGDGLKSDNNTDETLGVITLEDSTINISAGDDAIHAIQVIEIVSGDIVVSKSYEGIEAKKINILGGNIDVTSEDDSLNVTEKQESTGLNIFGGRGGPGGESVLEGGELNIYGGNVTINSEGDGFDSNGNAVMTGGTLIVNGPTQNNNGAIDVNGSFNVSGGTIIAVGSSGMSETPSETSTQYSIQVNFETTQKAGSKVSLQDASGNEIMNFESIKDFQSVTYSSDKILKGETYAFYLNGEKYVDLTIENVITKHGEGQRGPGGGGRGFFGGDREPPAQN